MKKSSKASARKVKPVKGWAIVSPRGKVCGVGLNECASPSAEMQKLPVWDKTIDALRMHLQRGFVRKTFDELIVYLHTLEREHGAMKDAMEYVRNFDPEKDTVTEKTYDEWGEAEAFRMCKAKSSEVLSSLTL